MAEKEHHSFLFADICDYSVLSETAGDEVAADVAIKFAARVAKLADELGVELVRRIGDAVMIHAECPTALLKLGVRLMDELSGEDGIPPLHAGIHTGSAVARSGDWWGCTVNIAARVANAAGKGQLLITEATKRAAAEMEDAELSPVGVKRLKNISARIRVYSATSAEPPAPAGEDAGHAARRSRIPAPLPVAPAPATLVAEAA